MYEQPASKVQAWRLPSDASVSKVGVLTVLVPRWLQIGALSLHWGSDWPVVFRINLTDGTHPLDPGWTFGAPCPHPRMAASSSFVVFWFSCFVCF